MMRKIDLELELDNNDVETIAYDLGLDNLKDEEIVEWIRYIILSELIVVRRNRRLKLERQSNERS